MATSVRQESFNFWELRTLGVLHSTPTCPHCPSPVLTSSDTRLSIAPSMECNAPREAGTLLGEPGDNSQAAHTCVETEAEGHLLSSRQKNKSENWAKSFLLLCTWLGGGGVKEGGAPMLSHQPTATLT